MSYYNILLNNAKYIGLCLIIKKRCQITICKNICAVCGILKMYTFPEVEKWKIFVSDISYFYRFRGKNYYRTLDLKKSN